MSCVSDYNCWIPPNKKSRTGSILIQKITSNQAFDTTFNFVISPLAGGISQFSIFLNAASTGSFMIMNVLPGDYTITELGTTGWEVSSPNPQTISVVVNQMTSVIFSNVKLGTIFINKQNDPIDADDTFEFIITPPAGGTGLVSLTTTNGTGSIEIDNVSPGTYTINEIVPVGWTGTVQNPVGVIVPGGQFSVTVSNTKLGSLQINKRTNMPTIGLTFSFSLSPGGATASITTEPGGGGSVTIPNVLPGSYDVTEINIPPGWTPNVNPATGIDVSAGATTIVNFINLGTGTLLIQKQAILFPVGTFSYVVTPGGYTATITTVGGMGSASIVVPGGVLYTILELPAFGWNTLPPNPVVINVPPGSTIPVLFVNVHP